MTAQNKGTAKTAGRIPLTALLTAVGEKKRWMIFKELVKGKPLPVTEIARRTGIKASSVSKHIGFLHRHGIVERGFGRLYEVPAQYLVAGAQALDFGPVLLRFDQEE